MREQVKELLQYLKPGKKLVNEAIELLKGYANGEPVNKAKLDMLEHKLSQAAEDTSHFGYPSYCKKGSNLKKANRAYYTLALVGSEVIDEEGDRMLFRGSSYQGITLDFVINIVRG